MPHYPIIKSALRWLEVILTERFGHAWHLSRVDAGLRLQLVGAEGAILFDTLCEGFTQAHSDQPCTRWNAERENWQSVLGGPLPAPGVAELPSPLIEQRGDEHVIHYDLLGLTYWMLARLEEIGRTDLDNHQRFPAVSSHAYKHSYLDRPVVDEWLHILGQLIQRQWPGVALKRHEPRMEVSCDVDHPFTFDGSINRCIRRIGGDLLNRRSPGAALNTVVGSWQARRGQDHRDPFRGGLDWIMDVNEQVGQSVAFYFIPEKTDARKDKSPAPSEPRMRVLFREIHARGHEIGIHPGYNTYRSPEAMNRSVTTLRRVLEEEQLSQPLLGGRQHYLRWHTPETARLWESCGLDYDSTLGFADHAGFRCGTCHEFPLYDLEHGRMLRLRERPLIVMECSVLAKNYMGVEDSDKALKVISDLRIACQRTGGNFTLLWHNSELMKPMQRQLYGQLITG